MKIVLYSFILIICFDSSIRGQNAEIKVIISAEHADEMVLYHDTTTFFDRLRPDKTLKYHSKPSRLSGSNRVDTLRFSFSASATSAIALKIGRNHPVFAKRLPSNNITIFSILLNIDTLSYHISNENFLEFFGWNEYVESINLEREISIKTRQWYNNIHPFLFLETYLPKEKHEPNSFLELDLTNKYPDIISISYNFNSDKRGRIDPRTSHKQLLPASSEFRKITIPFYADSVVRNFDLRMGYFKPNEFYFKSIKINSHGKELTYPFDQLRHTLKYNQFFVWKMDDILSFKLNTNFSGGLYYAPTIRNSQPIKYEIELLISRALNSLWFLLAGVLLFVVNRYYFRRFNTESAFL